ncbi:MAG: asparagine synthase-related protein, partial [Planctomycetota bacterium]|nr:asparagine synthase-related protein [Planctomycetota bacterium]
MLVAMSGGVDSSVAAALLKEQGHEVIGAFMRNGVKANADRAHRQGCCGVDDALDARRVADRLDVPFYALNFEDAFDGLIDDFVKAYAR